MDFRQTKVRNYFFNLSNKISSTPVTNIEDPVLREHKMARISLLTGICLLLGFEINLAKRQFEMWRHLRSREE